MTMRTRARFAAPRLELLEGRVVMDVSVTSVAGELLVRGTMGNDALHIARAESGEVTVLALGATTLNGGERAVSFTDVTRIRSIDLRAGDDLLHVSGLNLADGASIFAGRGNDGVQLSDLDIGADVRVD